MSDSAEPRGRPFPVLLVRSLRPEQWTKNLVLFAGLLFGLRLGDLVAVERAVAAFVLFCGLSGAVYLVNDVVDREKDRLHPLKSRRPIASGVLSPRHALIAAAVMVALALSAAFALGFAFGSIALAYVVLQVTYSLVLKQLVILDVLAIAIGFVLRAAGGALVIEVQFSMWLLLCTVLLALFLALSKRRHELTLLADEAVSHRRILQEYTPYLLDQMIAVVTASTLMAYAFYTVSEDTVAKFGTDRLAMTIPFPLYGIFRYLYLVHQRHGGGNPSAMLLTDRPLLACVALWAGAVAIIIYHPLG